MSKRKPLCLASESTGTVLIIDSLALRRAGVVGFLTPWASDSRITIIQAAGYSVMEQLEVSPIRMVLLITGAHGVSDPVIQNLFGLLHDKHDTTPIVIMSEREEPEEVVAAFKAGARGFISMNLPPRIATEAFTFIMGGGSYFPPTALMQCALAAKSMTVVTAAVVANPSRSSLTARQQDVLVRLRRGESNKLIGRQLRLRESTVKVHIRHIMRKLGATNRTQAALSAARLDLAESDEDQQLETVQNTAGGAVQ